VRFFLGLKVTMELNQMSLHLPAYQEFLNSIAELALPISASELHGVMCGYLCAGAIAKGETYLQALMNHKSKANQREAFLALFGVFTISHQQMTNFNFDFELLLPGEQESLIDRAQAFSEWCEGFTQGITLAGISSDQLEEDEAKEAMQHLMEFAQLDYESLEIDEADEKALMEVSEYTRMAVLRIHQDIQGSNPVEKSETAH
jgi:yecA family protein